MREFELNEKHWPVIRITDSWQIFKIMAEFVGGFEKLSLIGPCVSIFGSARTSPDSKYYQVAVDFAAKICQAGYGLITGGGPGIMEAGNKGAHSVGGKSVGLSIGLPFETITNSYIDKEKLINFDYFFVRKVMLVKYAQAFVVFPGGYGTLDELFEALTLIQTQKINKFPIVLVGSDYWSGMIDWIQKVMLEKEANISPEDMFLFKLADTADEAVTIINDFYKTDEFTPNF